MIFRSYWILVGVLVFSPLAFGSVEPWSLAVMEFTALSAAALFAWREAPAAGEGLFRTPGLTPLLLLAGLAALQLVPVPGAVLRLLSPESFRIRAAAAASGDVGWAPLSLAPRGTAAEFMRLAAAAAVYFLTVQLLAKGRRLRRTVLIVTGLSSVMAVQAILQYLFFNRRIFWLRELTEGGAPFGPFVNRNHYAGFMEMVFPLALAVFMASRPGLSSGRPSDRVFSFLSHPGANLHILSGLTCIITGTSVFLSLSRGGIISLCISIAVFGIMLLGRGTDRGRGLIMAGVCVALLLAVGWFGWKPIVDRFDKIRDPRTDIAEARPGIWVGTMRMIGDFPVFGTGFGSYRHVYPRYQGLEGRYVVEHAHNDYLELAAEGGAVGLALAAWFLWEVLAGSFRTFRLRRDPMAVNLYIGAVSGIAAILIHSMSDFNLHIGSNGLYFFFLSGLAVSASHTRFHSGRNGSVLPVLSPASLRWARPVTAGLLAITAVFSAAGLAAGMHYSVISGLRLQKLKDAGEIAAVQRIARRASRLDPLEPRYQAAAGDAAVMLSDAAGAASAYGRAVWLGPTRAPYIQRLGLISSSMGDDAQGERLLRAGIASAPRHPDPYREYGLWLMRRGERKHGAGMLGTAMALDPGRVREYIAALVIEGLTDEEIGAAIPRRAALRSAFADFLGMTGKDGMAVEEYREAVHLIGREPRPSPDLYSPAYNYFMAKGRYDDAVAVMQQASAMFPGEAGLRLAAAEAYEKAGMMNRAREEYRQALMSDPGNPTARRRLQEMR